VTRLRVADDVTDAITAFERKVHGSYGSALALLVRLIRLFVDPLDTRTARC